MMENGISNHKTAHLQNMERKHEQLFLRLNGIPISDLPNTNDEYLFYNLTGHWVFSNSFCLEKLFGDYDLLYTQFIIKLWGSTERYYNFQKILSEDTLRVLFDCGRNAETMFSKMDFSKFMQIINKHPDKQIIHKYLYTIDFNNLISNVIEVTKEVTYLAGDFYYILNCESDFIGLPEANKVGIRTSKNPAANKLIGLMALIYIRLHSLLDYHTKLAYELEKTQTNFDKYPRLSSKNKVYSDKNKLNINDIKKTLFEKDAFINQIDSYRNELIHNSLLDDEPRIYERYENNQLIERYLLLPDVDENGRLESYVNRRFFYSNDNKFNYILPNLLRVFQERQSHTLKALLQNT